MKDLWKLSDSELWRKTEEAASTEKQTTLFLLEHLREVQRRRLFANRGFSSLFEYVVKELKYSEAQASERINAMRLMHDVAEVREKIQSGMLSLTTASKIQRFVRQEKKYAGREFSREQKLSLINDCEGRTKRDVERILFEQSECQTQGPDYESERPVLNQKTELKFTVSKEVYAQLQKIRAKEGYDLSLEQIFERAIQSHLEKIGQTVAPQKPTRKVARPDARLGSRYISRGVKGEIIQRSLGQCEYVDPETKRRCESQYRLQLEHRVPFSLGGENTAQNLQHFCQTHNQMRAIQVFGEEKMSKFVEDLKR